MSSPELARLGEAKYVSLTTFKKDGTPVATPVWVARDGDHLYVITDATSGKAKRLRHNDRVEIAPCDMRGNVQGAHAAGTAWLLDEAGTEETRRRIDARYGLTAKVFGLLEKVRSRGSEAQRVGIEISFSQ